MTFLEKAKEDGCVIDEFNLMHTCCPYQLGLEKETCSGNKTNEQCEACWNREMPDTETKSEPIRDFDCELDMAYDRGLNDAWELAKKLYEMLCVDLEKIFDGHERLEDIFDNFTPQEALAKLKEYEDSKIEVGDVVDVANGTLAVITYANSDIDNYSFVDFTGTTRNDYKFSMLKKTGKHIDIQQILDSIGE